MTSIDNDGTLMATTGFRLGVLGACVTRAFADHLEQLDLTPKQVGLLAIVDAGLANSQRDIATHLQVAPSLVVTLVDHLAGLGAVSRERSATDRRVQVVNLTDVGRDLLARSVAIAAELDDAFRSSLSAAGRVALDVLLVETAGN